ncbi:hypothetical protein [Corynebacterium gerontici]|uniref:Uncharacterized protein n=1 Tax=Corynebacterium gerontici TaxID=2079234 RepID=A0A3G6J082_9CORY|nr:hypothetical protein [Corynebacterium gerontici]AZA10358.1 hypothetical protein CGERO_00095 [Corynebacterium gerontici]
MSQPASLHEANTQRTVGVPERATKAQPLIKSVTPIALVCVAVAAAAYFFAPMLSVIALLAAAFAVVARATVAHNVAKDLADMQQARASHAAGKKPAECAEFVFLRSGEMLARPHLFTNYALAQIQELHAWAKVEYEHA